MDNIKVLPQLEFMEAAKTVFSKFTDFKGRARRSEYWWGYLAVVIVSLLLSLIPIIGLIGQIFIMLVGLSMQVRRLHDTGRSAWWIVTQAAFAIVAAGSILSAIGFQSLYYIADDPELGVRLITEGISSGLGIFGVLCYFAAGILGFVIFIFTLLDSQPETNKYGDSPKYISE